MTRTDAFPLAAAARIPGLVLRLGVGFLRFQSKRKRGVRAFARSLRARGLSRQEAAKLAQAYHEIGSVRRLLGGAREL